ncbi:MAG: hypothetical protein GXO61_01935 [Epsilonproteobacteria bacterium]|nr:hypothetical protein [Campylobacterota bacterium]
MKKLLLTSLLLTSSFCAEIWVGVGKIGGDIVTSTEYAIGVEEEFELFEEWLTGVDVSYKHAKVKEEEEEESFKVWEDAVDVEGLIGKEFDEKNKLFGVVGLRYGQSDGDDFYGVGVGAEFQHLLEDGVVVSIDIVRHFMKNEDDRYYQTNTLMFKVGYEF